MNLKKSDKVLAWLIAAPISIILGLGVLAAVFGLDSTLTKVYYVYKRRRKVA